MELQELALRIGSLGTISLESEDGFEDHRTRVEDVRGNVVSLAVPTKEGQLLVPEVGEVVSFTIEDPSAGKRFLDGEAIAHTMTPVPMVMIRVLAIGRDQKRQHFRLTLPLRPAACSVWGSDGGNGQGYWRPLAAMVQDLSAGGARVQSNVQLDKGTRVRIRFPLPASVDQLVTDAVVCVSLSATQGYAAGLKFEGLAPEQQERIAKHIHMYQLEARRSGRVPVET